MVNYQWGIFWANLNPTKGSEQSGTRPVLVISAEAVNKALPVVTIVSLTSVKPGRNVYSIEAYLPSEITGLSKDSIAMGHQIRAISKERIKEQCGFILKEEYRDEVRKAIKNYLDLA
jgi:mRNA interferase MazF